jgi:hypothetical protein
MNDTDSATFVLFDRGAAILRSRDIVRYIFIYIVYLHKVSTLSH